MTQFSSKSDLCRWLNEFKHPNLIEGWLISRA